MSDLVEKVATKIQDYFSAADRAYGEHDLCARAAIAAVAEWGRSNFYDDKPLHEFLNELSAALRKQLEQPK